MATLTQSGGTLGGTGTLTVSGLATITGGSSLMNGTGITRADGGLAINGSFLDLQGSRTLVNGAGQSADWSAGTLRLFSAGTTLTNEATAVFNITGNSRSLQGSGLFDNQGSVVVNLSNSTQEVSVDPVFNNSGSINAQTGVLRLGGGGTDSGSFTGGANGTIAFSGGTHTLDAASSVTATNVRFSNQDSGVGNTAINGTYNAGNTVITGDTASFNGADQTGTLTQSGGTLGGTGTLTVSGLATITGGSSLMNGTGITRADGGLAINGSFLDLQGSRTLVNGAGQSADWSAGTLRLFSAGTTLTNEATAVFNITGNSRSLQGSGLFDNQGSVVVNLSNSTQEVSVDPVFNNSGSINAQTGVLRLGGGGTDSGSFTGGANGTIAFSGGTHTLDAASSVTATNVRFSNQDSGVGNTAINGTYNAGNTVITGDTASFNGADQTGTLTQSGGTLGGTGTLTVSGLATITGGSSLMNGTGITRADGGLAINGSFLDLQGSRTLVNGAGQSADWSAGTLRLFSAGTTLTNEATAVFNITGNSRSLQGSGLFDNQGSVVVNLSNSTQEVSVDPVFNNSGSINAQTGVLRLGGGGTDSGSFTGGANGTIAFSGGTHTLDAASSVTATNVRFSNQDSGVGNTAINGTYNAGNTVITGDTASFNGADQTGTLTQSGGTLGGTGTLTVSGLATITGGSSLMNGTGITRADGGLAINGSFLDLQGSRTLVNGAGQSADWSAGTLRLFSAGTTLTNEATAVFNITGNSRSLQGSGLFDNQGSVVVNLSNSTQEVSVDPVFNNSGSINAQTGVLRLGGGGTDSGSFTGGANGTIAFSGGTHTLDAASSVTATNVRFSNQDSGVGNTAINGTYNAGNTVITGDTASFNGADQTGTLTQSGGTLGGTGTLTVSGLATITGGSSLMNGTGITRADGGLAINGSFLDLQGSRTLVNGAGQSADWSAGTLRLFSAGTTLTNEATAVFNITGNSRSLQGSGLFDNQGSVVVNLSNSTQEVSVDPVFNNSGSINAQTGVLRLGGGGTDSGSFTGGANGTIAFSGGTHTLDAASSVTATNVRFSNQDSGVGNTAINGTYNAGNTVITGDTASFNGADQTGTLTQSGGTLGGTGTLTVSGLATITGGSSLMNGTGITRADGGLAINGSFLDLQGSRTLVNGAGQSADWSAGTLRLFSAGTTLTNEATAVFNITGNSRSLQGSGLFDNQGSVVVNLSNSTQEVSVDPVFNNSGLVDAQAGTLLMTQGIQGITGTLQLSGGIVNLQAASTTGNLFHNTNAANSLILGTHNITVSTDYNNANFGVGNAFNLYANVSHTTGQILAAPNVAQAITGAGVTNGTTATPTLTIGNVHVGINTVDFQVANTGTTGPSLRGAIQTSVNGGNITDPNISVTPQNWGPVAPGSASGNIDVSFNAGSAGTLSLQPNQQIHITNNFDNVADQDLIITLGAGAAAYNLAAGNATPSPVPIPNQRVGGKGTRVLTVMNTAPAGSFTEGLNASFGANTGDATNNGGVISLLAGQGSDSAAMSVGVDASSAGAKSGTVTLNYVSDGTGTSGLGLTSVASQIINVSGNVYRLAQGAAMPTPINFGNVHVGDIASQVLTVQNTAANDGFSEGLNASFGANTGSATNNGGSISVLAAGGSDNSSMSAGLDTSSAGAKSGSVTLNYASDGSGTSGLAAIAAGSQGINLSGNVYRLASANTLGAIAFGNVHVGDVVQQALSISNTAANDGFSEKLNASFGSSSDARITSNGSITQLAAGSSDNSSMVVGLDTTAAGTVNGTQTINFASDGTGTSGLGITALASQIIGVSGDISTTGNVYNLASASPAAPNPVNFGNVRVGTVTDQALSITNTAANDGFSEKLNASISSNGAPVTATGSFNLLAAQSTDSSSLHVGIDTSSAGAKSGSATIALASDGTGTSGLGITPLTSQTVNVSGNVYRLAQGEATPLSVNFGNVRVLTGASQTLSIQNLAANDGFSEKLNASFGTPTGTGVTTNGGSVSLLAAQGNDGSSMAVGIDTSTAGAKSGMVAVNYESDGTGTSGLAAIGAGSQTVNVSGNVYRLAQGSATPTPINFGNVHVGDTASQVLTVQNTAANDGFSEGLNASFGANTGSATNNGGSISVLAAGGSDNSAMSAGLDTSSAGAKSGSVTLNYASDGSGTSGLSAISAGSQSINLSGTVYNLAKSNVIAPINIVAHVGDGGGSISQALAITNVSQGNNAFQEGLNSAFGTYTPGGGDTLTPTFSGVITNLAAGSTDSSSMTATISTATAGLFNGSVVVNQASNGTISGLADTPLTAQNVGISGSVTGGVFTYAQPTINTAQPVNFGNVRVGTAVASQAISISNTAPVASTTELLDGSFVSAPSGFTGSGSFSGLAPGAAPNTSIQVGMDTSTAGAKSGNVAIDFVSNGTSIAGDGTTTDFGNTNVAVQGNVYRLAHGETTPLNVNFGNVRVLTGASQTLTIQNQAANDGFSEKLNASFGTPTGTGVTTNGGSVSLLAAQGSDAASMAVGIDTASAGVKSGTVAVNYQSDGTGTSGLAAIGAGSQTVNVSGNVYRLAQGAAMPTPINFGNVHVGDIASQVLTVQNTAANDGFSEGLNASFGANTGSATNNGGSISVLAAGGSNNSAMSAGIDTSSAGAKSGSVTLNYASDGSRHQRPVRHLGGQPEHQPLRHGLSSGGGQHPGRHCLRQCPCGRHRAAGTEHHQHGGQ